MWFRLSFVVVGIIFFFILNISFGSVWIPFNEVINAIIGGEVSKGSWELIVRNYRLPQAITAFLAGGSLAFAGLMMQTLFRNPLAGPSVLGVSSGASLGVALLILMFGSSLSSYGIGYNIAISLAALIGSGMVLFLILTLSKIVRNNIALLIAGIMIGYLTSSIVGILNVFSNAEDLKTFMLWGLGSFSDVGWQNMPLFSIFLVVSLFGGLLMVKPLNAILLGDQYAYYLGVPLELYRFAIIIVSGLLTAIVTAWCGPIAFVGLAVPHLARAFFQKSDHRILMPGVFLLGGLVCLICNLIARLPGTDSTLPINTITSAFGAPVVIWYIIRRNKVVK